MCIFIFIFERTVVYGRERKEENRGVTMSGRERRERMRESFIEIYKCIVDMLLQLQKKKTSFYLTVFLPDSLT